MRRLALLAVLALSACGGPEAEAKREVAALLRDPGSAQFRNVYVKDGTVCGEVNGRNAFGAYAGYQRFVYDGLLAEIEPENPSLIGADETAVPQIERRTEFLRRYTDCLAG